MARSLSRLTGVRAGEGPIATLVAGLFLTTVAAHGISANTADALFFERYGVENLPRMVLFAGFVVLGATVAHMVGQSRVGPARWLPRVYGGLARWAAIERLAIPLVGRTIYPVIWLGAQVTIWVTFAAVWNAAAETCDTRQAKRLFPLFAAAGIGGGVLGNVATGPGRGLGTENLLVVQSAILAATVVFVMLGRRFAEQRGTSSVLSALGDGFRVARHDPLMRSDDRRRDRCEHALLPGRVSLQQRRRRLLRWRGRAGRVPGFFRPRDEWVMSRSCHSATSSSALLVQTTAGVHALEIDPRKPAGAVPFDAPDDKGHLEKVILDDDGLVFGADPGCELVAVDLASGATHWRITGRSRRSPRWGVVAGTLVQIGHTAAQGQDTATGRVEWRHPVDGYAAPVIELDRLFLSRSEEVTALDLAGRELWRASHLEGSTRECAGRR